MFPFETLVQICKMPQFTPLKSQLNEISSELVILIINLSFNILHPLL